MSIVGEHSFKPLRAAAWPSRVLRWWLGELRGAWDDALQQLHIGGGAAVTVEAGERYWTLRRKQRPIGQIDVEGQPAEECRQMLADSVAASGARALLVEIPPERVLSKVVSYPAAARAELDRIVGFDIPRHFPFAAERVLYRYRVLRAPAGSSDGASLAVEVVAVPREIVGAICSEFAAAGLTPAGIALVGSASAEPLFLPASAVPQVRRTASPNLRRLALALLIAVLAALASWPLAQRAQLGAIDREIAELKPHAEAALKARQRRQQQAERVRAVLGLRAARPAMVVLLDALSRDLPDKAWLMSLSVSGRDIVMDGLSPSAAEIALALQKSGVFKDIVFRAPVTREAGTGLERFQLGATIAGSKP